jgi:hypothetical protein
LVVTDLCFITKIANAATPPSTAAKATPIGHLRRNVEADDKNPSFELFDIVLRPRPGRDDFTTQGKKSLFTAHPFGTIWAYLEFH